LTAVNDIASSPATCASALLFCFKTKNINLLDRARACARGQ
jgi:hypothetical protein